MKNRTDLLQVVFAFLAVANILAVATQTAWANLLTKPLLLSTLSLWFYLRTSSYATPFSRALLAGLILSIAGDTLLMFVEAGGEQFFLLGLGSFLAAQIAYIAAFLKYPQLRKGFLWNKPAAALPFVLYFSGILLPLWKDMPGGMKLPVTAYALIITTMAMFCLNMKGRIREGAFRSLFAGALLFVLSDSMIALTKFSLHDAPRNLTGAAIMITYLAGQYGIARGSLEANDLIKPRV